MNLVVIVSDTFRWDYLGAYGNEWIHTPHLDALASESAVFLDAYAEALPTLPVRRVLMTGRNCFPFDYRPQKNDSVQVHGWHPLYDEDVTLAEHLAVKGYCTVFFNDVYHMMKPGKNFHRGFEQWFWTRGHENDPYAPRNRARVKDLLRKACPGWDLPDTSWIIRHLNLRQEWQNDADTIVGQTMTKAAQWVRDYALDRPFYLHVECFDPHEPWDPPRDYAQQYEPAYGDSLDGVAAPSTTKNLSDQRVANIRAAYAGEVTLVDRWIGHLLDALRDKGLVENTLVLFTSDHGCMMGEQGEIHKGATRLRNQCTRIPLFIRHPAGEKAGERVNGFCQHQDIMPTLLSLLGEDIPDRVLGRNIWSNGKTIENAPDYVVSAFGKYACIRTEKWNYIRLWSLDTGNTAQAGHVQEELYDLENDPEELTNVIGDNRATADELANRLEAHIKKFAPLTTGSFQSAADSSGHLSFDALPKLDA